MKLPIDLLDLVIRPTGIAALALSATTATAMAHEKTAPPRKQAVKPAEPKESPEAKKERKILEALVVQLGDEEFEVRTSAYKQLLARGKKILPFLRAQQAGHKDLEIRTNLKVLIAHIDPPEVKQKNVNIDPCYACGRG